MFKQYINAKSAGNPEEEREMNILNYSTHFFNVLTQFGKYYNPEIDSQIILDAVCDKFGLTFEEYARIYQKHYIGNKDASLF